MSTWLIRLLSLLVGALALACIAPQLDAPERGGVLVIAGGAVDDRGEVLPRFVTEVRNAASVRGEKNPLIEVIPTASGNPAASLQHNCGLFLRIATAVAVRGIELSVDDVELAASTEVAERLSQASGLWFTGGDQSRITSVFRPKPSQDARLHATALGMLANGGVIGGSSAGAAVMSETMLAGGKSEGALLHGEGDGGVKLATGLGLFPFGIVDQHFLARGRLGRLLVALELKGQRYGFGVEENSAFVAYLGERLYGEVVGSRGVCILDRGVLAQRAGEGARKFELSLLGTGDRWDFTVGVALPRTGRVELAGNVPSAMAPGSNLPALWEPGAIEEAVILLARDTELTQVLESERFRLKLSCGPQTVFRVAPGNASDLFAARVECHLEARR